MMPFLLLFAGSSGAYNSRQFFKIDFGERVSLPASAQFFYAIKTMQPQQRFSYCLNVSPRPLRDLFRLQWFGLQRLHDLKRCVT